MPCITTHAGKFLAVIEGRTSVARTGVPSRSTVTSSSITSRGGLSHALVNDKVRWIELSMYVSYAPTPDVRMTTLEPCIGCDGRA